MSMMAWTSRFAIAATWVLCAGGRAEAATATSAAAESAESPPSTPAAAPAAAPGDAPAPAPATPPASGAPAAGAAASGAGDVERAAAQGDYHVRLRDIEERVNQLKEKIFQSKARLIQLQEVVLHGTIAGAKAIIIHRNEMGSSFKLTRIQYALDGAPIVNRVDAGGDELEAQDEIEVYSGNIAPGDHQISVYLEYQGNGYGVFSYLQGYKFKIKSSYTFNAEEGKLTTVRIVGYEKGGLTTELKDRPAVRYDVETARDLRTATDPNAAEGQKGQTSPSQAQPGGEAQSP